MSVEHVLLALILILGLSLLAQPVSRLLRLPYSSVLVVLGFVSSELVVFAGIDTGIRADNFKSIIFYVFIPVLALFTLFKDQRVSFSSQTVMVWAGLRGGGNAGTGIVTADKSGLLVDDSV